VSGAGGRLPQERAAARRTGGSGERARQTPEGHCMHNIIPPHPPTLQQFPRRDRDHRETLGERLLDNRILFLSGVINEYVASEAIMALLYLQSIKKDQDVNLYINSPGGVVDQTLAIYDTIQFMGCDVATYCIGQAASGAALLLMAGTPGKRYILPNAKVMLHQPSGGITGQAEDIRIQAEEILRDKKRLNEIIAKHTGQNAEKIQEEIERDRYMSADEALTYGVVDEILKVDVTDDKKKKKKK
jgi:ATP-dependent Clp protease protease subunit